MLNFFKYNSTGNDFILIDNRDGSIETTNQEVWAKRCKRCFGIGADGVVFLESSNDHDFHMRYLNADGSEESMCGNATRAITDFYKRLSGNQSNQFSFTTRNGVYRSEIQGENIWVEMTEIYDEQRFDIASLYSESKYSYFINTGVEHSVFYVDNVSNIDLETIGPKIRHNAIFPKGSNANFVQKLGEGKYEIRTFERGVEGETYACGTGNVAAACMLWNKDLESNDKIEFKVKGGVLFVRRNSDKIYLGGQTKLVYEGRIND